MNLRRIRESRQLSQQKLADISGVHRVMISRYEVESAKPSYDTMLRLANALGTTVDELMKDSA